MWENRIKLERFVYHESARKTIKNKLDGLKLTDESITEICVSCDGGYVLYKIILSTGISFTVFDDGNTVK